MSSYLISVRRQLTQFGNGVLLPPGPESSTAQRLLEPWVQQQLQRLGRGNPDISALRVLDPEGAGLSPGNLSPEVQAAMDAAFEQARRSKAPAYRFVATGDRRHHRAEERDTADRDHGGADIHSHLVHARVM